MFFQVQILVHNTEELIVLLCHNYPVITSIKGQTVLSSFDRSGTFTTERGVDFYREFLKFLFMLTMAGYVY